MTDRDILERIAVACEKLVAIAERRQQSRPASGNGQAIASDRELDGQHGDPQIRMKVRDWSGADMKGKRASECPPDFLELYADTLEWAAGKDAESDDADKRKYAPLKRKDAARCRAWALRIRDGKHQAPQAGATGGGTGQDDGGEWGGDSKW